MLLVTASSVVLPAYASTSSGGGGNFFSGLIQFISQKFGLDQTQVKTAVQSYKQQQKANRPTPSASQSAAMQQKMQDMQKKRLDTLVTQGKITSDQETAIITELNALHTKYLTTSGQTRQQMQTNMKNMQTDWQTWAKANNIDPTLINPGPGFGGRGGPGGWGGPGRHGFGKWNKTTPTPTP